MGANAQRVNLNIRRRETGIEGLKFGLFQLAKGRIAELLDLG